MIRAQAQPPPRQAPSPPARGSKDARRRRAALRSAAEKFRLAHQLRVQSVDDAAREDFERFRRALFERDPAGDAADPEILQGDLDVRFEEET